MIKTHIPARPRNKKIVPTGGSSISPSISSAVGSSHTHNNKSLLDLINQGNIDVLSKLFVDESDNLYTTQNFYSQQGVSAYGHGVEGGGSVDLSKLLSWTGYTSEMADFYAPASLLVPFYNDMQSRVGAIEAGGSGGGSTVTWGTESGGYVPLTVEGATKSIALSTHNHSGVYEPAFSKNTAFNKNFGTTSGTVAQGNDSRIVNGQTAYGWGNHSSAGYALSSSLANYVTLATAQTISGAKTFSANLTASVSVTTPKVIFAAAGWSMEQSGTELVFKYNGVIKQRMLSTGTILATGGMTALTTA